MDAIFIYGFQSLYKTSLQRRHPRYDSILLCVVFQAGSEGA